MANRGVGKFKVKPTIAPEQAVNGAGAKPHAASSMHAQGSGGRKDPDERNISRDHKLPAPDHRVPTAHRDVGHHASPKITEPSR